MTSHSGAQAAGSDEVQGRVGQQPPRRRLRRREAPSGDGGADGGLGGREGATRALAGAMQLQ
jgi:hypothetical protein